MVRSGDMTGITAIVEAAATVHDVTVEDVMGRSRELPIVTARHHAQYIARRRTSWSYESLGRIFGRDSKTVRHAVLRVQSRIIHDPETAAAINAIFAEMDSDPPAPTTRAGGSHTCPEGGAGTWDYPTGEG